MKIWTDEELETRGDKASIEAYDAGYTVPVYRKQWTRIRPGLYARLIGTELVEVEKCSRDWCPSDYRGWAVRQRHIGGWEEELWENTYATFKEAQRAAEQRLGNFKKLKARLLR